MAECWLCNKKSISSVDDCDLCAPECPLFGVERVIDPLDLVKANADLKVEVDQLSKTNAALKRDLYDISAKHGTLRGRIQSVLLQDDQLTPY